MKSNDFRKFIILNYCGTANTLSDTIGYDEYRGDSLIVKTRFRKSQFGSTMSTTYYDAYGRDSLIKVQFPTGSSKSTFNLRNKNGELDRIMVVQNQNGILDTNFIDVRQYINGSTGLIDSVRYSSSGIESSTLTKYDKNGLVLSEVTFLTNHGFRKFDSSIKYSRDKSGAIVLEQMLDSLGTVLGEKTYKWRQGLLAEERYVLNGALVHTKIYEYKNKLPSKVILVSGEGEKCEWHYERTK